MQDRIDFRVLARPLSDTLWEKLNARWQTGREIAVSAERALHLDPGTLDRLAAYEREMRGAGRRLVWKGAPVSIKCATRLLRRAGTTDGSTASGGVSS